MKKSRLDGRNYISLTPIPVDVFDNDNFDSFLPADLGGDLFIEDVSALIRETSFDLLVKAYGQSEVDRLKTIRYAVVHPSDFSTLKDASWKEKSSDLLYRAYLAMRVIRPMVIRFQVFHFDLQETKPFFPAGSRNDICAQVNDFERTNAVTAEDLEGLRKIIPSLELLRNPQSSIAQAIQSLEIGYRADFFQVRHLLWVVGLDALFTSQEYWRKEIAIERIVDFLGDDFEIYPLKRPNYFPPLDRTKLKDILQDIYKLRNHFAHGTWPDRVWAGRAVRASIDGSQEINYATVLSEGACVALRASLAKIMSEQKWIDIFGDKHRMNSHFTGRKTGPKSAKERKRN